jgi:hypothetical protein
LAKSLPYPRVAIALTMIYNIWCYLAEHWTMTFYGLSRVWYDYGVQNLGLIQIVAFFYFSYHNVQAVEETSTDATTTAETTATLDTSTKETTTEEKPTVETKEVGSDPSTDVVDTTPDSPPPSADVDHARQTIWNWIYAFFVYLFVSSIMDWGVPKNSLNEQVLAIATDGFYNITHFLNHSFLFVMAWHVSSFVKTSGKMGKYATQFHEHVKKVWNGLVERPLISSCAACVCVAVGAIAVENVRKLDMAEMSIPLFPPFCYVKTDERDMCTLLGITIPCHKAFSEDSLDQFGLELEMCHLWTFFITLATGLVSLWNADLQWPINFREKSLKITCALYAIETSLFALIRFYWGVSKPLVAAAAGTTCLSGLSFST